MKKCSYQHKAFKKSPKKGWQCNEKDQCWLTDVANFGTEEEPKYFCVFHAPEFNIPIDNISWDYVKRGLLQADKLKKLLDEWSEINRTRTEHSPDENALEFVLPGIQCGPIRLGNYTFRGSVIFNNATFCGHANFSEATFCGNANFEEATFYGRADFKEATFNWDANFDEVTFSRDAYFGEVIFSAHANFREATFSTPVSFEEATFSRDANFKEATFSGFAYFSGVTFNGYINFKGTTFSTPVSFEEATFSGHVIFDEATFSREVNFNSATFNRISTFRFTTFKEDSSFINSAFKSTTNYSKAVFIKVPRFHNAELHQDTNFMGANFLDKQSKHAPRAYRTLKQAMNEVHSREEEARFYAYEQESRRHQADVKYSPFRLFSYLYHRVSDYGRSFTRPVGWLIATTILFAILYFILLARYNMQNDIISFSWQLTMQQVFKPFAIWSTKESKVIFGLVGHKVLWFQLIATVQSILSITFITLFLLAVRRTFKLS